ncbi:GntR family transcriptional regulator [Acidovorax sp. JHL-9]|uniref:GntR family transcriptional regulator n=1 Tax=Acidovorax sp. JHL-9 TaxID=1276756 RepID=UPI00047C359F|nr:GntR family transcriptional regulator [Acidovorax sp. JHL-9]
MPPSTPPSPTSKRSLAYAHLMRGLEVGRWPVGTLLPTEAALCAELGVSRHTVRAALAEMQVMGLVVGHQGVGTRVMRRKPELAPSHSLHNISDLALYARNTTVRILDVKEVMLDEPTTEWIGTAAGETWCLARTLRTAVDQEAPIVLSSVWVPLASKSAIEASGQSGLPVFIEVQRLHGHMVSEVRQVIGIGIATREQAARLRCKTREPLLRIQRWYYDSQRTLLEVTDSLHPQDRFQYSVTLRHVSGSGITQSPPHPE